MPYIALRFDVTAGVADDWADALLEAGALSVDAADAQQQRRLLVRERPLRPVRDPQRAHRGASRTQFSICSNSSRSTPAALRVKRSSAR